MLEEGLGFQSLALKEQNPSESVEIGGIVRFSLNGLLAHIVCFLEILALNAEVICIVVQHIDIVWIYLQCLFISLICLFGIALQMVDVSGCGPCPQGGGTVIRSLFQHCVAYFQHPVVFFQIIIPHTGHLKENGLGRETPKGFASLFGQFLPLLSIHQIFNIFSIDVITVWPKVLVERKEGSCLLLAVCRVIING